jgi:hypothetical protein
MRLRIISNGTGKGTRVVDAKTGEEIEGVTSVEWFWSYEKDNAVPSCKLTVQSVPLDAELSNHEAKPEKEIL